MLLIKLNEQKYFSQGNMMGAAKGAGPRINMQYPKSVPVWCANHQLNRVIVQSCTEPCIRNMIGTIDSVSKIYLLFYLQNIIQIKSRNTIGRNWLQ